MIVYINTENHGTLNMRAEPNTSCVILARIPFKTMLQAEKVNEEWSKVTYDNKTGYVMNKFLSEEEPVSNDKEGLKKIYNSLKATLKTIEEVLK